MTNAKRGRRKTRMKEKAGKKVCDRESRVFSALVGADGEHILHIICEWFQNLFIFSKEIAGIPICLSSFPLSPIIVSIPPSHSIANGEEEEAGFMRGASERETEDRERGGLHHKECNTATVEHQQGATGRSPSEWVIDFNVNHRSDRPQHNRNAPNSACVWAYVNTHETCT